MTTTERPGRAWLTATVTMLLAVVLAGASGLLWEILDDQDVSALSDVDSALGVFVLSPLAPLGGPGIVGDRQFSDSISQLAGGLVVLAVVVFLLSWLAARSGSAFAAMVGAWLGTILGTGLGALASFEILVRQDDLGDAGFGLHQARLVRIENGLYWGAAVGLLLGLVAMAVRAMTRRSRGTDVDDTGPAAPWPPATTPPVTSSLSTPRETDRLEPDRLDSGRAEAGGPSEDTVVAPEHRRDQ